MIIGVAERTSANLGPHSVELGVLSSWMFIPSSLIWPRLLQAVAGPVDENGLSMSGPEGAMEIDSLDEDHFCSLFDSWFKTMNRPLFVTFGSLSVITVPPFQFLAHAE